MIGLVLTARQDSVEYVSKPLPPRSLRAAPLSRKTLGALLAALMFASSGTAARPQAALDSARFAALFDGTTLSGWTGDPTVWSVKDDAIDGASAHTSGSYLSTNADFTDFRVIFEERKVASNNHLGLGFWGVRNPPGDFGANKCILVITPPGAMWDYGSGNLKGAMLGDRFVDPDAAFNFQWHLVEIVARMSTGEVAAAVDGVPITQYTDPDPGRFKSGPLRLQLHGLPTAQEMQYRKIKVERSPRDVKLLTADGGASPQAGA